MKVIPEKTAFDEDKWTKILMIQKQIDKVRGGDYNKIDLTPMQKQSITIQLQSVNEKCLQCGGNHFVKDCPMINGNLQQTNNISYNFFLQVKNKQQSAEDNNQDEESQEIKNTKNQTKPKDTF